MVVLWKMDVHVHIDDDGVQRGTSCTTYSMIYTTGSCACGLAMDVRCASTIRE